eukprot:m.187947 g.187947  ORF g.187947 m.187947 type:complete len:1126 (-) comp21635_c1_seq3:101-3478(-)
MEREVLVNRPEQGFVGNAVCTTKYTTLNFIPRNLFEQFHRGANVYFLLLVVLNWIPQLNVFGKEVSMLPLIAVLGTTMIKDGYENYRRRKSDNETNARITRVVRSDTEVQDVQWKDVQVGDVVLVRRDEEAPADLVLVHSSGEDGLCYVSTMNLDGETSLKARRCVAFPAGERSSTDYSTFQLDHHHTVRLMCERPSRNLESFDGYMQHSWEDGIDDAKAASAGGAATATTRGSAVSITIQEKERVIAPVSIDNLFLRGSVLRNTAWVKGVVVYAGHESKIMLNNRGAASKRSQIERTMNWDILSLVVILLLMCIGSAVGARVWLATDNHEHAVFYMATADDDGPDMIGFLAFWKFIIVYQVIIPIALYISMELVKGGQAYFISQDLALYDDTLDFPVVCRALNIAEDLGQVSQVFSDKTGTLTENCMKFQFASVGGMRLRVGEADSTVKETDVDNTRRLSQPLSDAADEVRRQILLLAMAVCSTVIPSATGSEAQFEGESPDEVALVCAASQAGCVMTRRTQATVTLQLGSQVVQYNLLHVLPFDSSRRRMSVIISEENSSGREIRLLTKGADVNMFSQCNMQTEAQAIETLTLEVDSFAREGLRTLVFGQRLLTEDEFSAWDADYHRVITLTDGRADAMRLLVERMEVNLSLVGVTAVEDKLSLGVPETITALRAAGITVWLLTGDKQETAVTIGAASQLIPPGARLLHVAAPSAVALRDLLQAHTDELQRQDGRQAHVMVIEGAALAHVEDPEVAPLFLQLATLCASVICFRTSPSQKARVVATYQALKPDAVTLAIGDGANDVNMIQTARVGVGIAGREGRQASMASDFAFGKFYFLGHFLLVHGHWCYSRLARMVIYFFYKNTVFVFLLMWHQVFCGFSAQNPMNDLYLICFALVFTSTPTIITSILDQDLDRRTLNRVPSLYSQGPQSLLYHRGWFWLMILESVWQSLVLYFVPYFAVRNSTIGLYQFGTILVFGGIMVVNFHLALDTYHWTIINHVFMWGSIAVFLLFSTVYATLVDVPDYYVFFHTMADPRLYFCVMMVVVLALLPRYLALYYITNFRPSLVDVARHMERKGVLPGSWEPLQPINTLQEVLQQDASDSHGALRSLLMRCSVWRKKFQ